MSDAEALCRAILARLSTAIDPETGVDVVRKAAQMARQLSKPSLGVENMSYFDCPDTGQRYEIFGPSHAERVARGMGALFLGRLPIDPEIAKLCDAGRIESYPAEAFAPIAEQLARRVPAPSR